jgi:LmbE family N-acetylglucosaminyl deacetylase
MLNKLDLIARQKARPTLLRRHRSLGRLASVITVMNTGAHPDDEQSGMLALFRYGFGMRVVIACATRGEGGQNALGPERTATLGVLRTREMEEAARELDADIAWLGHGPDDPVHDFGFSKDGDDTLRRWGKDRTIERLVRSYRTERPDIVIPTFLDVPGQHGHHRAMTRAAKEALALAADPAAYPAHFDEGLRPWRVAKFYLPAWSGGGGTYDDEVPPPNATLTISAPGRESATGAAYDQIGEWSRLDHASQGMGVWKDDPKTAWPLHLLVGSAAGQYERTIEDGLPATLGALGQIAGLPASTAMSLREAQAAIDAAIDAFPRRGKIIAALLDAARHLDTAKDTASADFLEREGHRLDRKRTEIDAALIEASGLEARAFAEPTLLAAGTSGKLVVRFDQGNLSFAEDITIRPYAPAGVTTAEEQAASGMVRYSVAVAANAESTSAWAPFWSSLGGNGAAGVCIEARIGGRTVAGFVDLDEPLRIVPRYSAKLDPETLLLKSGDTVRQWPVELRVTGPEEAVSFKAPAGWRVEQSGDHRIVRAPQEVAAGVHEIVPLIGGAPAFRQTSIAYSHIGRAVHVAPEILKVLALDLALPTGARTAYVGGGADHVGCWLDRMGLDVTELPPGALDRDFSKFTTIVVGIFAFGLRPDLVAAKARLHGFVEGGGHLVTLYHRPSDGWDPASTPPRRLEIGSPSLRWRVTNPDAPVDVLTPDHPLLSGPNRIGLGDWAGWDKERGLYFASRWDEAYEPLLAMHDAGEPPLEGALVSARIGKGRHTHTSLVLHHQLDKLVSGAFRLMANLVQPAR